MTASAPSDQPTRTRSPPRQTPYAGHDFPDQPMPSRPTIRWPGVRAGSSVGTSVRLKSGRSAVRSRPCPRTILRDGEPRHRDRRVGGGCCSGSVRRAPGRPASKALFEARLAGRSRAEAARLRRRRWPGRAARGLSLGTAQPTAGRHRETATSSISGISTQLEMLSEWGPRHPTKLIPPNESSLPSVDSAAPVSCPGRLGPEP
jgi:hypothetical protein